MNLPALRRPKRVLIQAGHTAPRHAGFESATGAPGELELVHQIQHKLILLCQHDRRLEPVHYHGDLSNAPKESEIELAIFLHANGSNDPHASGYSFGYPGGEWAHFNKTLADMIAAEFEAIGHPGSRRADSHTRGLAGYYGYLFVDTPGPELVVEHGFLTNPRERVWMFANTGKLALAEYRVIGWELGLERGLERARDPDPDPAYGPKSWPIPIPTWYWRWARWYLGRGEYAHLLPREPVARPCDAPYPIPKWAWARLDAGVVTHDADTGGRGTTSATGESSAKDLSSRG